MDPVDRGSNHATSLVLDATTGSSRVGLIAKVRARYPHLLRFAAPVLFVIAAWGIGSIDFFDRQWPHADSTAEWLAVSAAADGLDPYADLKSIAARYGVDYRHPAIGQIGDAEWTHPRSPAALLLLQPVTLTSPPRLFEVTIWISVGLMGFVAIGLASRLSGWTWPVTLLAASLVLWSGPMLRSLQFGAQILVVATLVWIFWSGIRDGGDAWVSGVALGLAVNLRLFPALLAVGLLLQRKYKALAACVFTVLAMNVLAVVVLDLDLDTAIQAVLEAGETWTHLPSNGSLVPHILGLTGLPILSISLGLIGGAIVLLTLVARSTNDTDLVVGWGVLLMVLVSPLAWEAYDLFLLVPLAVAVQRWRSPASRYLALIWLAFMIVAVYAFGPLEDVNPFWSGRRALIGRCVLAVAMGVAWFVAAHSKSEQGADRGIAPADGHTLLTQP